MARRYRINEIFFSLQGEGYFTGNAAVFVRFSGCNLYCPFCDTRHGDYIGLTEDEIIAKVKSYKTASMVIFTGGEPSLQLTQSLVDKLKGEGYFLAIETNGTHILPDGIDWVVISPKEQFVGKQGRVILSEADEIKLVYNGENDPHDFDLGIEARDGYSVEARGRYIFHYLQPCYTGDTEKDEEITRKAIEFVKENGQWRLSLQTQRILKIR